MQPRRTILAGAALLVACSGSPLDRVDPAVFEARPTWTDDIGPLLEEHCVSCHDGEAAFDGGVELATWPAARSTRIPSTCTSVSEEVIELYAEVLVLPTEAAAGQPCLDWQPLSMPPGAATRLSPTEQVLLARWVELGAPE